jgi:hypothetical protein
MLFIDESERRLPIVPTLLDEEQSPAYKKAYERQSDKLGEKFGLQATTITLNKTVVRADLADRQQHADTDARAAIEYDARIRGEFLRLTETDVNTSNPDMRAAAFLTARYLPNFELYARLAIGERTSPVDSSLAEIAFQLLAEEHSSEFEVANDVPSSHIKVVTITSRADGDYAVVSNKTSGLTLADESRKFDLKHQRTGIFPLKNVEKNIRENAKILSLAPDIEEATEDQLRWFRQNLTDYLLSGAAYFPVIDRFYMNLTPQDPGALIQADEVESESPQSDA